LGGCNQNELVKAKEEPKWKKGLEEVDMNHRVDMKHEAFNLNHEEGI
jgi:hypothetical protein